MTTPPEIPEPFSFNLPEDYEERLEEAKRVLLTLPKTANRDIAEHVLAMAPALADIEAAQQKMRESSAALMALHAARHAGRDPDETTKVVLKATGGLHDLAFSAHAKRLGDHDLANAITHAWSEAEAALIEAHGAQSRHATALGGGTDPSEQVLADIEYAVSAREHERFEANTEAGNATATVNLRGRLIEIVFLQSGVLAHTDRATLAAQLTAAVRKAQSAAATAVAEISTLYYDRMR